MEAYQYKIRVEKSKTESINFDPSDVSLSNCEIKVISRKTASDVILEYEWLKSMPYIVNHCFGIYFNVNDRSILGGVLVFSIDYAENTGVWKKYMFEDKLLLLSRGVCLWWTPKNTASYFITRACQWIKSNTKYRIITATVDPAAGEIGTIYQSLNWHYTGVMSGNYSHNKESKRFSVMINGKLRYSRWVRNDIGSMKKSEILKKYSNAIFLDQYRKRRYFYFMDDKKSNNIYLNAIKSLIQPYPKRNENVVGIIYLITNKVNNKKYVGQTIRSLNDRINDYRRGYGNDYLNKSIEKYGWNNFEFTIIDTAQSIIELNNKEIRYINEYNTCDKNIGYNIEAGGRNSIPTTETLKKMSISHLGIKQNDTWINKRISKSGSDDAKKYGKPKTELEKNLLSLNSPKYWQGKKRDEETIKKISQTKKEKGMSAKQKELLCKKVYKVDAITNDIIETFDSTLLASISENVNQSTISRWCSGNKIIKNIQWRY